MNCTDTGEVRYQREDQHCDDCKKVTVNVRALNMSTGWVSDWTCIKEVEGKPHPKADRERKGVLNV